MARDPELLSHKSWMGYLQPVGLVVSPPALVKAQAVLASNVVDVQQALLEVARRPAEDDPATDRGAYLDDFPRFAGEVLGWKPEDLAGAPGGPDLPVDLEVVLTDYAETLRPTFVALDSEGDRKPLLLVQIVERGLSLDEPPAKEEKQGWHSSPQAKFERLLREKGIPAGLLGNGYELRLVHAPRGETSGHLTFPVQAMCEVPGRPILAALHMLLSEHRVWSALDGRRLLDLLSESRKYQNEVSTQLADQVLGALWELLRGFQAADEAADGQLLGVISREDPQHVYGGMLTVLLRLVFLLYAEDQGLMPEESVYSSNYAVTGLYARLREDAGRYPDTMDQRYGAWAWLVSLFRLVFDGGGHSGFHLPTRHGQLFNPDEYPFLEGRPRGVSRVVGDLVDVPRVSDGCIHKVLEGLLILAGERLSYRALDVEQIGSVYEAMMGFAVERAHGRSIAVKPKHVVFDVDELLEQAGGARVKWLKERTECDLTGKSADELKDAKTPDDVVAALGRKLSPRTPRLLAPGALYLQPGEERRRSGSHYTPRELTEPIVRTTLRPVLENLGPKPRPEQILDLKVCDPAMGSGAFLVEACRQLAEQLVTAWEVHACLPALPPDEEPLLHARRLVAQRCLYGVDKNPFAVNLAKLSLWLVTLARNHAFTFLDHALKHGDSLVGLTREQIAAFDWKPEPDAQIDWIQEKLKKDLETALGWRTKLHGLDEGDYIQKKEAWQRSEEALHDARLVGDLVIAAFFGAEKDKQREALRQEYRGKVDQWKQGALPLSALKEIAAGLRSGSHPIPPLHWEIEFPEVLGRTNPGFDAIVGNPPFFQGRAVAKSLGAPFRDWLLERFEATRASADIVALFYRQSFSLIREDGAFGLIATKTISKGDTRYSGLRWICTHGGTIFAATKRKKWPGSAAVVVSIINISKGPTSTCDLDGRLVPQISAFLFPRGGHDDPESLRENSGICFNGCSIYGVGFTFDDSEPRASSSATMRELISRNPKNAERIFPFLGGDELNRSPTQEHDRWVINFGTMSLKEASAWPDLVQILEEKVKPERLTKAKDVANWPWWQFWRQRPELMEAVRHHERMLVVSFVSEHLAFAWLPSNRVVSHNVGVFARQDDAFFAVVQSRIHECFATQLSSGLEDRQGYRPSDGFEPFPFPGNSQALNDDLGALGKSYCDFRAALMIRNAEGLTKTYNRFHDPNEQSKDILKLRELHAAMDKAVLEAYGWSDIPTACDFFLDYEIDEETWGDKKKPYRYRWPDEVRDEVLARLLDLNQKRAEEERLAGLTADAAQKGKPGKKAKGTKRTKKSGTMPLFGSKDPDPGDDA